MYIGLGNYWGACFCCQSRLLSVTEASGLGRLFATLTFLFIVSLHGVTSLPKAWRTTGGIVCACPGSVALWHACSLGLVWHGHVSLLDSRHLLCTHLSVSCTPAICSVLTCQSPVLSPSALYSLVSLLYTRHLLCTHLSFSCTLAICSVLTCQSHVLSPSALYSFVSLLYSCHLLCTHFSVSCTLAICSVLTCQSPVLYS